MSLQWTLIAGFLYVEIAVVLLLVLPVASPKRWHALFKSRFLQGLQQQSSIYFMILLAVLVLFLLDAIREMKKYSFSDSHDSHPHLDAEMQSNMRLFRAQRNFYISGFALFLSLVIRRLVSLISSQAGLLAETEALMKQAQGASAAARSLMAERREVSQNTTNDDKEVEELRTKVDELQDKLRHEIKDKYALKEQAENLSKQYDSLAEEHTQLQKQLTTAAGDGESKKDD